MPLAQASQQSSGTIRFDLPSNLGLRSIRYMTFVPDSCIPVKVHSDLSGAKNSIHNRACRWNTDVRAYRYTESKILELVDGAWYVLYEIKNGATRNSLPWVRRVTDVSYEANPEFKNRVDTPNVPSYIRVETPRHVVSPMTRDEYAEWRIAVDREARKND